MSPALKWGLYNVGVKAKLGRYKLRCHFLNIEGDKVEYLRSQNNEVLLVGVF